MSSVNAGGFGIRRSDICKIGKDKKYFGNICCLDSSNRVASGTSIRGMANMSREASSAVSRISKASKYGFKQIWLGVMDTADFIDLAAKSTSEMYTTWDRYSG
ncbi:hypothetical protein CI102_421 [Trichoderma harzianum]|nr:hypothetical protein CI102_421 [Trichoderma harzianum]